VDPPAKLLGADEHVVIHTRTHAKALILPALALILIGGAVGVGTALMPAEARPIGSLAVVVVGLVLVLWLVVVPYLRWWTTTYTVTNRRLMTRSGILNKTGTDLPLNRINEVAIERSLLDRILGCGTLMISTAAEDGTVVLADVPDAEHVHPEISELLFGTDPRGGPTSRG
jgi:membrane protein YdbS with pleckstrin-like domain